MLSVLGLKRAGAPFDFFLGCRDPQLAQRFSLDLAHALTGNQKHIANLLQGVLPGKVDAKPVPQHDLLPRIENR